MVTSTQQPDKKVVKMAEQNSAVVIPQRTLLGEVNEHITCPLCRGYYIDATTIVECLHSFCRSCIIKHLQAKSYCPVCEMMINSAKPNIKLDKALQDIVYKLVPGLFQKEMERRQQFYASRPGPAASATPEQRGEDTERIIFSPEDVISFSLEYCDVTDTDSISSKSSDSNESQPTSSNRRYLQCPAVVNICHLKKFLSMKFDIDSTQFAIDILYKRVPLPDYYTLMDIAYIYNWKRNEPMRFFYQIIDYVAIRNRLFDVNRKSVCPFGERKSSPAPTEDTNASSPAPHLNEQGSEASSGTDSPMLDERQISQTGQNTEKVETLQKEHENNIISQPCLSPKKNDDEVEKSQFLNSFELTAKSNCLSKTSPIKPEQGPSANESASKSLLSGPKVEEKLGETSKRKYQTAQQTPELKKLRIEIEKAKLTNIVKSSPGLSSSPAISGHKVDNIVKTKESEESHKKSMFMQTSPLPTVSETIKDAKHPTTTPRLLESPGVKRTVPGSPAISSPKRKPQSDMSTTTQPPTVPRTVSPLKLPIPKPDISNTTVKTPEVQKQPPPIKKMPDLKPGVPMSQSSQNKVQQPVNKIRMDLLANNSDFTKPKSSLASPSVQQQQSGDPLKSLFDSCKINIPSSLSITLTEQKQEARNLAESLAADPKKNLINKNLPTASNTTQHKVPSPSVHNYIEILKLPDTETKKPSKPDGTVDVKTNQPTKSDTNATQAKPPTKSSESSAKGPIPNLKPISDTKIAKQSGNFSAPITFQQTFEQQLQTMQSDKKTKGPKNKAQVPKLVPATPKSFNLGNKPTVPVTKPNAISMPILENKPSTALDLSTPHNIQNQLLTMQSIDNLAKKQNLPTKGMPLPQSNVFPSSHRSLPAGVSPLRIPSTPNMNLIKSDKSSPSVPPLNNRHDLSSNKSHPLKSASNVSPSILSSGYQIPPHTPPSTAQPSPRSQTRSPSTSPKLVIAEEKQGGSSTSEQNMNQSNQISSTQIPNLNSQNNEHQKVTLGATKVLPKSLPSTGKLSGVRQPIPTSIKPSPNVLPSAEYLMSTTHPQVMTHNQNMMQLRHQMEMNAWAHMYKNMAHQMQNEFNNKDKQQ